MRQRLEAIYQDLETKGKKQGKEINLVAVTKFHDIEKIEESIKYGVTVIAENRAQDFIKKAELLDGKVKMHFIGHLQRNKVRKVLPYADLIHSVDSLRLIKEIDKQAKRLGKTQNILLQVNIAKEEQKYGFMKKELGEALALVEKKTNVKVVGMMMMAPFVENPEEVRVFFKEMSELFDLYKETHYNNVHMDILSMGMSGDYEVAIEEGSNMVRIGSAIYKEEE